MITYRKKNGKYIFSKGDGVYFTLTDDQVRQMNSVTSAIIRGVCDYQQVDARKLTKKS